MPSYPDDLSCPFSRGTLSRFGVGWREVAGPLWRSPYRDVHVWSATDATSPRQRAIEAAALLPSEGAVGGWAAAAIGNDGELDGRGLSGQETQPVLLCLPRALRIRRDSSIRPFRSRLDPEDVTIVDGVPVTVPLRTAFDIARLTTRVEAVCAIDYLARGRPEFLGQLTAYTLAHRHLRNARLVLAALSLASPRSLSGGETRFRLLWVGRAGLPAPEVNAVLRSADGALLGITDLLDVETGLAGEYDGSHHRLIDRHTADNAREERFEAAGVVVVRATASDLGQFQRRTIARLQDARRRAYRMPPEDRRWTWEPGPLPRPAPHW